MGNYKPPKTVVVGTGGPHGVSKIQVKGSQFRVVMQVKDPKTGIESEEKYVLSMSNQDPDMKKFITEGDWYVSLSSDHKKVYSVRPVKGVFNLKFVRFYAQKDETPVPTLDQRYPNSTTRKFAPVFKIMGGKEDGMEVKASLNFWFQEIVEDGKSVLGYEIHPHPKAQRSMNLLLGFCDEFGLWDYGAIPYSDNPLPNMEKRLLKAAKVVKTVIQGGFIDSFLSADDKPDTE